MTHFLYNIAMYALWGAMKLHALFNHKTRLAVDGRKDWRKRLKEKIDALPAGGKRVWFHASSLGEFEQGRPVMESLKKSHPDVQIILTFFSPSGYEVRRDYTGADVIEYLPIDTPSAAHDWVKIIKADAAVFIKYEFWANYLYQINRRGIPLYLISARFYKESIFFRSYGGFMRKLLHLFTHIYTQDTRSEILLDSLGLENHSMAGDTRFDRVRDILKQDCSLPFMDTFCKDRKVIVGGSMWEDDYRVMTSLIKELAPQSDVCYVIAPHNINREEIEEFRRSLPVTSVCYSQMTPSALRESRVLILDTIGILTRVYSYAHISYVGGGWTPSGIHNVLEPAVFSRPVICGPLYTPYIEAVGMYKAGGLIVINDGTTLISAVKNCMYDTDFYNTTAHAAGLYVEQNAGATSRIVKALESAIYPHL